ncbi:ankyrin repeat domain-containing protein, partial [Saccharopolyspora sp. WRP15-2]
VTGSVGMLEALLPAHPDFALTNRYGGTALIPAGEHGHVEYIRAAVRTGIDVNHVNDLGWTALLEAVVLGDGSERYQQAVRTLVDAGADVHIRDRNGVTALEHAESDGYTEIADILRSAP